MESNCPAAGTGADFSRASSQPPDVIDRVRPSVVGIGTAYRLASPSKEVPPWPTGAPALSSVMVAR